jgi:4-amino-4-deoxy-L-arabinose transferase-like glycosyltransferase
MRADPSLRWLALILCGVAILLLAGLSADPPVEHREIRIFRVISGMVQTGDYWVPRMNGSPHLTKPPLYYWAGAACAQLTWLPQRIAYRLPSVLCALLVLALTFWLCRSLELIHLALPSVLILTCCHEFYLNARSANYDMMLTACALFSVVSFHRYLCTGREIWLPAAGIGAVLALLTKATPAVLLIGAPVLAMAMGMGKLSLLKRPVVLASIVVVPLGICLAWYALMWWRVPEAGVVLHREGLLPFGVRAEGRTTEHFENPLFYAYKLFKITAPAFLLFPLLLRRMIGTRWYRGAGATLRWVAFVLLILLLFFSIIPKKQENYLLPILPFLALLMGDSVLQREEGRAERASLLFAGGCIALLFVLAAPACLFFFGVMLREPAVAMITALICLALALRLTWQLRSRRVASAWMTAICGWWFCIGMYFSSFEPLDNQFRSGEIYQSPGYSKEHWDRLFERYPPLRKIFSTSARFEH